MSLLRSFSFLSLWSLFILSSKGETSFPDLHTPNKYNAYGEVCPLLFRDDISCPILCAKTPDLCPPVLDPTAICSDGQVRCSDGNCHEDCSGITNPCSCDLPSTELNQNFVACASYASTVSIELFNPKIKIAQIETKCLQTWGLLGNTTDTDARLNVTVPWDVDPVGPLMFLTCPIPPEPTFDYTGVLFMPFYIIIAFILASNLLWKLFKNYSEKNASGSKQIFYCSNYKDDLGILKDPPLVFIGFKNNVFGSLLFLLSHAVSLGLFVTLLIIVADYYGAFGGIAYNVYLSSNNSMGFFIVIWHVSAIWFTFIITLKKKIRNFYRIRCVLSSSDHVQVEEDKESIILTQSSNPFILKIRGFSNSLKSFLNFDKNIATCKIITENSTPNSFSRKYFEYHCMRLILNTDGTFETVEYNIGNDHTELINNINGLTQSTAAERFSFIGENFVKVNASSYLKALIDELTTFFYLYQAMCLWTWFYFNYYKMGSVQLFVIAASAFYKAYLNANSEKRVKKLAEFEDVYSVKRDGKWKKLSSRLLVPGDVVSINSGIQLCFDGAVLSGEVIVDESSLTGESMPVRKFSLKNDNLPFDKNTSGKVYTIFSGTRVLQCTSNYTTDTLINTPNDSTDISKPLNESYDIEYSHSFSQGQKNIRKTSISSSDSYQNLKETIKTQILVLSTGINTNKGQIIRKIMYPSEYSFVFDEHLNIVIGILAIWSGICFSLTIWLLGHDLTSWFYGIFIISQILSPLLPASFVVGQSVAAGRLSKSKIFCIDLPRIMVAGKVKVFCFDKTGTLTKEGLEFSGVQAVHINDHVGSLPEFGELQEDILMADDILQIGLASCHSVSIVNDTNIGNPVDIEQFKATDWEIIQKSSSALSLIKDSHKDIYLDSLISPYLDTTPTPGKSPRKIIHIVKRFEFEHSRQCMSVAVFDPETQHAHVFIKGSFEKIKAKSKPNTIPHEYDSETSKWASEGCYLLAIAHKDLGPIEDPSILCSMSREEMESECNLLALIMFRNKLKEDTSAALAELRRGNTRCVMITGDNALTGIYISRASGMISESATVILGDIEYNKETGEQQLTWKDSQTQKVVDIDELLSKDNSYIEMNEKRVGDIVARNTPNIELAVTSACFDYLVRNETIRQYLYDIRVFSRMTPQGKVAAVKLFMEKNVTAMCGDGGNDCGALRAAHVGIALSETDASIVSPFSTSNKSIYSCINLLIHGRTALATSFAVYKFLILYGETMAWLELFQFYFRVIVPESIWIFIDSFIAVGLLFALTQAQPAKKLVPYRPTAKLLGFQTMLSTVSQVLINLAFLFGIFGLLYKQNWFRCNEFDSKDVDTSLWWLLGDSYEAETLSIVLLFQFINAAGAFNFGYRYRKAWIKNYVLVALYTFYLAIISYICLADPNRLGCLFRINCGDSDVLVKLGYSKPSFKISSYNSPIGNNVFPKEFRWKLWGIVITNTVVVLLFEYFVVLGPIGLFLKRKFEKKSNKSSVKI
ncbi:hypothetical protein BB561_002015 [Smittium simulii]|uniref:P-type ATPase A domain-containing protein n=1 Tax=Smittium simulii TaxID=133385 RepID=A0A2T9YS07_9FUNG|nr:hypothetical protein BB561_002015 [Smittium simulii]